jgi:hypothetical protein
MACPIGREAPPCSAGQISRKSFNLNYRTWRLAQRFPEKERVGCLSQASEDSLCRSGSNQAPSLAWQGLGLLLRGRVGKVAGGVFKDVDPMLHRIPVSPPSVPPSRPYRDKFFLSFPIDLQRARRPFLGTPVPTAVTGT